MKPLLCLFLLLTLLSVPAWADDSVIKGTIGKPTQPPSYTTRQFEEALKVSDDCKLYSYTNTHYDCDCVGMTFLELRRKEGGAAQLYQLREKAQSSCPNTPAVAGKTYTQCLQWAPSVHGEDYQEFCACYSSTFAKLYGKNPSEDQYITEAQMISALSACDVNAPNKASIDRESMMKQLKNNGTYYTLFPSAKTEK